MKNVPLITLINELSGGKFASVRLKYVKYFKSADMCEINFLYTGNRKDAARIEEYAKQALPPITEYKFLYTLAEPTEANLKNSVAGFVRKELNTEITGENIEVTLTNPKKVALHLNEVYITYAQDTGFIEKLEDFLNDEFCAPVLAELVQNGGIDEETALLRLRQAAPPAAPVEKPAPRRLKVFKREKYIGDLITEDADYISDAKAAEGSYILCGSVSNAQFRNQPRKNDPEKTTIYLKFLLTCFGDYIDCIMFGTKTNAQKLEQIKDGDVIIAEGTAEKGNFGLSFKIRRISFCELPKSFTPFVLKAAAPENYLRIIPAPYGAEDDSGETTLLGEPAQKAEPPQFFRGRTFVVFDVETTGTDTADRITEIGAVKIVDGRITETFSTLVNPQRPISEKASEVSHITDDMVKDAPLFTDVCADFYKFCEGAELVGQNVNFDLGFVNKYSDVTRYKFEHRFHDTLELARKRLKGLRNYKLATLLNRFNIINTAAHRALSDAEATAKLFIKLMEMA